MGFPKVFELSSDEEGVLCVVGGFSFRQLSEQKAKETLLKYLREQVAELEAEITLQHADSTV